VLVTGFVLPASAAAGPILQLPKPLGCLHPGSAESCGDSGALSQPSGVVLGPEGRTAYVANPPIDEIAIFDVDPASGALTRRAGAAGCVRQDTAGVPVGCAEGPALNGVTAIAISSDGEWLFTGSLGAGGVGTGVTAFDRNPQTGAIAPLGGITGCITNDGTDGNSGPCVDGKALPAVSSIAVDGGTKAVYALSTATNGSLAVLSFGGVAGFSQNPASALTCFTDTGTGVPTDCTNARQFNTPIKVVVAPDGANVYVTNWISESIVSFKRDATTGGLEAVAGNAGCADSGGDEGCLSTPVLGNGPASEVSGIAFKDPGHLYVTMRNGQTVAAFNRGVGGALEPRGGPDGCVTTAGSNPGNCAKGRLLFAAANIAITPNGKDAVVASIFSAGGGSLTSYDLAADGDITPVPGPAGCIAAAESPTCATGFGFTEIYDVTVHPNGRFLYADNQVPVGSSPPGIAVFVLDPNPPTCQNASATTAVSTVVRIPLTCSDADGDPMTLSTVSPPSTGAVSGYDQGARTVDFAPAPGFLGTVSFSFKATSYGHDSAPATVTIEVKEPAVAHPGAFGAETQVTLALAKRRIPAAGPLPVVVSNGNDFAVGGTLAGKTKGKVGPKGKPVKLGAKRFTAPAKGKVTVQLTLPTKLRSELLRKGRLSLLLSAKAGDPAGNTRTVTQAVTPKLKKKR
jgi:Bacterial Ig domain